MFTRTADYPQRSIFVPRGKKVQQITHTGLLPAPQNRRKSCYCITGTRTHKLGTTAATTVYWKINALPAGNRPEVMVCTAFYALLPSNNTVLFFFVQIAFETLQFVLPNGKLSESSSSVLGGPDPPFCFLVVLHVALWVIVFISDRILQCQHHKSQAKGYLQFFRETKELRRLPQAVLSLGTVFIRFGAGYPFLQPLFESWRWR